MLERDKPLAWKTIEERIIRKVNQFSGSTFRGQAVENGPSFFLENLFTAEIPRLREDAKNNKIYLRKLEELKDLYENDSIDSETALRKITRYYLKEITGNLNPFMVKVISVIMPKLFSFLFVRKSIWKILRNAILHSSIKPFFRFSGKYRKVQKLEERGTLIVCPTHSSNLDSPVLGLALLKLGLPPLIYGAGINLFVHKFYAFFMNKLGAYKVDRLKKSEIYKMVLKEYCTYSIEAGYDNLFFPGGTRSRSGEVENKLKTGLLSCGLEAYKNNVSNNKKEKKIYIIPITLNYHSVLEAPTLIEDHLKSESEKRFIISDDESSKPNEIYYFLGKSSKFYLHFGDPLDPFGNRVNEEGESVDEEGNVIDISKIIEHVKTDDDNYQAVQKTARVIVKDYQKHNVILNPNLLAKVIYDLVKSRYPDKSDIELSQIDYITEDVDLSLLYDPVVEETDRLRKMHQKRELICSEEIITRDIPSVLSDGIETLTHFHWPSAIRKRDDKIIISNFKLLIFYKNKVPV